jgi:hypothetical protein
MEHDDLTSHSSRRKGGQLLQGASSTSSKVLVRRQDSGWQRTTSKWKIGSAAHQLHNLSGATSDEVHRPTDFLDQGKEADEDEEDAPLLFVVPPSEALQCGLHEGLLVDPVIAPCGHTFCRACVAGDGGDVSATAVLAPTPVTGRRPSGGGGGAPPTQPVQVPEATVCPVDGTVLQAEKVIANLAVAGQLRELPVHCKYGVKRLEDGGLVPDPDGCPEVVPFGARRQHEATCHYAPAQCPYCDASSLRRMNVAEHTRTCSHIPCPHKVQCPSTPRGTPRLHHHRSSSESVACCTRS